MKINKFQMRTYNRYQICFLDKDVCIYKECFYDGMFFYLKNLVSHWCLWVKTKNSFDIQEIWYSTGNQRAKSILYLVTLVLVFTVLVFEADLNETFTTNQRK